MRQETRAAKTMQSLQRGKVTRRATAEKRAQKAAATKMQTGFRGKAARAQTQEKRAQKHAARALGSLGNGNVENQIQITGLLVSLLSTGREEAKRNATAAAVDEHGNLVGGMTPEERAEQLYRHAAAVEERLREERNKPEAGCTHRPAITKRGAATRADTSSAGWRTPTARRLRSGATWRARGRLSGSTPRATRPSRRWRWPTASRASAGGTRTASARRCCTSG